VNALRRMSVPAVVFIAMAAFLADVNAEPSAKRGASSFAVDETFSPTDLDGLRRKLNRRVAVEGTIVSSGQSKTGTVRYLNFTKNYRESLSLVFLAGRDRDAFPVGKLQQFVGKKVRIGGLVSERGGALQMRVFDLAHLKVLP
jgi:hypothetical protein